LIYVSEAAGDLTTTDLDTIARQSRDNNHAYRLTGFLLYQRPRFYAVLEGPRDVLFARMELIATDARHVRLRVLREDPVPTRRFLNWSFGHLPETAQDMGNSDPPAEFLRTLSRRL